jgi:hypothetical protein
LVQPTESELPTATRSDCSGLAPDRWSQVECPILRYRNWPKRPNKECGSFKW